MQKYLENYLMKLKLHVTKYQETAGNNEVLEVRITRGDLPP